jgi:ABC-type Fe3+ transport system permease subunit
MVSVAVPIANLSVKAGWVTSQIDGNLRFGYSWSRMLESVLLAPYQFATEFKWTLLLAVAASSLAWVTSLGMAWLTGSSSKAIRIWWTVAILMMALPGPTVNLLVLRGFDGCGWTWLQEVRERTLLAPVLALQFRCLPASGLVITLLRYRWLTQNESLLQADGLRHGWSGYGHFVVDQWRPGFWPPGWLRVNCPATCWYFRPK